MNQNRSVEDFILNLQDQIGAPVAPHVGDLARLDAVPRIRIVHEGGARRAGSVWDWHAKRYPGEGNRLARRAAAKGRAR